MNKVTLPNGLNGTLHSLADQKMAKIKKACESIKWNYSMIDPKIQAIAHSKKLHVLTVRIKNKKVHFVLGSDYKNAEIIQNIFDRYIPELLFRSVLSDMTHFIVFNNIAYPRSSRERKILIEAVKNKIDPKIQAILHSEKN